MSDLNAGKTQFFISGQNSLFHEEVLFCEIFIPFEMQTYILIWLFQNEMNNKFHTLPSLDDFAKFVTGAELEDALQGIRQNWKNL